MLVASVAVVGAFGLARWGSAAEGSLVASGATRAPMATSQQAASLEAMSKIATDLSFLADDVRAVRTGSWAKPMHAFGDGKNEIQFALEKEGRATEIGELYRDRRLSETQWDAWPEDLRSSPGSGFVYWDDYVRRRGTPKTLAKRLQSEVDDLWEVTSAGYQNTLDALFADATFLDDVLGEGGYHFHISFKHRRAMADAVVQYWRHVDEYLGLRALFRTPDAFRNVNLRPVQDYQFREMRRLLRNGEFSWSDDEKFHFVGLRTGIYGKDSRIGLEIRGAGDDLGVSARMVRATTRFLADPKGARFHLHRGAKSYRLRDITRPTETDIRKPQGDRHPRHMTLYGERALPYVRWEQRPWLAPYKADIRAAREAYTDAIHDMPFGATVDGALHEWAQTLRLHEHY